YGIRTLDTSESALSSIEYAEIKYPVFGVTVDSLSCNLFGKRFSDSDSGDIHITRDVRILPNHEWRLFAPTKVVVDSLDPVGFGFDATKNELIVSGSLRTERPSGIPADSVVTFTSHSSNPSRGDWHGIEFVSDVTDSDAVASIGAALIEYCETPLSFTLWDSAMVADSRLQKFTDTGVDLLYSTGTVSGCEIYGNDGVSSQSDGAFYGIHSLRSAPHLVDNEIGWHWEHGVKIEYTGWDCILEPVVQDSILVEGNSIQGNGEDDGEFDEGWGAQLLYMCDELPVRFTDNTILDWPDGGLDLNTCLGARLECNTFQESFIGLRHTRGTFSSSPNDVQLRQNAFVQNSKHNLESDDVGHFKLYEGVTGWSRNNSFRPDTTTGGETGWNIVNAWGTSTLNARYSAWKSASTGALLVQSDSVYVREHITGIDSLAVNIKNFSSTDPAMQCVVGGAAAPAGPESRPAADGDTSEPTTSVALQGVPEDWSLIARAERGRARVRFGIPARNPGDVRVVIYDVSGRRVAVVAQLHRPDPGWREVAWAYRDGSGASVASGVYFLRLESPDRFLTRKIVVLR
ncbi:T9SS type A sorting domain-containing protein, partial [bacterium]|nr:T9SS type A sorting domain-containing protein [bacterium]